VSKSTSISLSESFFHPTWNINPF